MVAAVPEAVVGCLVAEDLGGGEYRASLVCWMFLRGEEKGGGGCTSISPTTIDKLGI